MGQLKDRNEIFFYPLKFDRQTETDRERQSQKDRERERDRQAETEKY